MVAFSGYPSRWAFYLGECWLVAASPRRLSRRTPGDSTSNEGWVGGHIPALGVRITNRGTQIWKPLDSGAEIVWTAVNDAHDLQGAIFYYVDVYDFRSVDSAVDLEYVKAVASVDFRNVPKGSLVCYRLRGLTIIRWTLGAGGAGVCDIQST
jgi:hypothetical protein